MGGVCDCDRNGRDASLNSGKAEVSMRHQSRERDHVESSDPEFRLEIRDLQTTVLQKCYLLIGTNFNDQKNHTLICGFACLFR